MRWARKTERREDRSLAGGTSPRDQGIAAEGEPRPQRVVALGPEPPWSRKHDVVGLQCRAVEAPALRVEDVSAPSGPSASSASSPSVDPASSGRLYGGTAHLTALASYVAALETHRMGDSQPSSVVRLHRQPPPRSLSCVGHVRRARLVRRADALCDQFCDAAADAHTGQIQADTAAARRAARGVARAGFGAGLRRARLL